MRKLLVLLISVISLTTFGQFSPTFDTVRLRRGGKVYEVITYGEDSVKINGVMYRMVAGGGTNYWQASGGDAIKTLPDGKILKYTGIPTTYGVSIPSTFDQVYRDATTGYLTKFSRTGNGGVDPLDGDTLTGCGGVYVVTQEAQDISLNVDSIASICGCFVVKNMGIGSTVTLTSIEGLLFDTLSSVVLQYNEWASICADSTFFITFGTINTASDVSLPFVNVKDHGAKGDNSNADEVGINAAIDYAVTNNIKTVVIPSGHYLLQGSIKMKNGIQLLAYGNPTIELKAGSDDYLLTNAWRTTGNSDIEVSGGKWIHNGKDQNLATGGVDSVNFSGYGFYFKNVKNLKVHDLEIDSCKLGAIVHQGCDNFYFGNIVLKQYYGNSRNGDGISGESCNGTYENITGYTNDDMIGLLANTQDIDNIIIRNVRPELLDSAYVSTDTAYSQRAVRLFAAAGNKISNVSIDGIVGTSLYNPIQIDSYDSTGEFYNVSISNVNAKMRLNPPKTGRPGGQFGFITIDHVKWFDNINISNINCKSTPRTVGTSQYLYHGFSPFVIDKSFGNNLNISNVNCIQDYSSPAGYDIGGITRYPIYRPFIYDAVSGVKTVTVSNVYHADSTFSIAQVFYEKDAGSKTQLIASNIQAKDTTGIILNSNGGLLSLNTLSFPVDTTKLSPNFGDVINGTGIGLSYYTTKWSAGWASNGDTLYYSLGNVGVGLSSPATSFVVDSVVRAIRHNVPSQYIEIAGGNSSYTYVTSKTATEKTLLFQNISDAIESEGNQMQWNLGLVASPTTMMTLTNIGRLGIGDAYPDEKLHVKGRLKIDTIPVRANVPTYAIADSAGLLTKYAWPTTGSSAAQDSTLNPFYYWGGGIKERDSTKNIGLGEPAVASTKLNIKATEAMDYAIKTDGLVGMDNLSYSASGTNYLSYNSSTKEVSWTPTSSLAGSGTVTSIATTSPITGGTITTTGTISIIADTLTSWHTKQNQGAVAHGWGDHASAGYITDPNGSAGSIIYDTGDGYTATNPTITDRYLGSTFTGSYYAPAWVALPAQDSVKNPWVYNAGNTVQRGTGKVGIGKTAPDAFLTVNNNVKSSTAPQFRTYSSVLGEATPSDSLGLYVDAKGYVGIGKTNPGNTLDITGGITASSVIGGNGITSGVSGYVLGNSNDVINFGNVSTGTNSQLAFYTKNTEKVRIKSSGEVGIGTTAPTATLHVNSRSSTAPQFRTYSSVLGEATPSDSLGIYVDAKGYVGVGKTNPGYNFESIGTAYVADRFTCGGTLNMNTTTFYTSNVDMYFQAGRNSNSTNFMAFNTNNNGSTGGTERMRITAAGLVGIGTTAPDAFLTVNNNVKSSTAPQFRTYSSVLGEATPSDSLGLYVDARGYVGVGTTAPGYVLDVSGIINSSSYISGKNGSAILNNDQISGNFNGALLLGNVNSNSASAVALRSKNTEAVRINPSQQVGIGTTAPNAKLHVESSAANDTAARFRATGTGNSYGATAWGNLNGIYGYGVTGRGVLGYGAVSGVQGNGGQYGVLGTAGSTASIRGEATAGDGVQGFSTSASDYGGYFSGGKAWNGLYSTSANFDSLRVRGYGAEVGVTNKVDMDTVNAIRLYGNTTVWDDLAFQAGQLKQVGTNAKPDYDNEEMGYLFPYDSTEMIGIVVQMPHRWKEESSVSPHIHWIWDGTGSGVDTLVWRMKYRVYDICDAVPSSWTTVSHTYSRCTGLGEDKYHMISEFPEISMTGMGVSALIDIKIFRKNGVGINADALFKMFDLHFEIDALGSKDEYSK